MAPKSAPFTILLHYTGKKSNKEMQAIYADFYIGQVKSTLTDSHLCENEKKAVIDLLISCFT